MLVKPATKAKRSSETTIIVSNNEADLSFLLS